MAVLRQIRGQLVRRPQGGGVEVVANGRGDWVGWVDLTTEPVTAAAIGNTARVIRDLNPHILGVVEAENRVVLKHFTDAQLRTAARRHRQDVPLFPHVMLIDGNDDRGIDVALLTQRGYPLGPMRSHIDDTDERESCSRRDCPEYELRTPGGHRLVVLVNHLKSKGYGSQADEQRHAGGARPSGSPTSIAASCKRASRTSRSWATSTTPLTPRRSRRCSTGTDLRDISTHPGFDNGGRPGTFGNCTATQTDRLPAAVPGVVHEGHRRRDLAEWAPGAGVTAPCGRTTTPSPRRPTPHPTMPRSTPTWRWPEGAATIDGPASCLAEQAW